MMFTKTIRVKLNERVVIFRDGLPQRAYPPGRYRLWGTHLSEQRWDTNKITFSAYPEVRAVLPKEWYREVSLEPHERAVLYRNGAPQVFLRPGVHTYWVVDPSVKLVRLDVRQPLTGLTQ